MDLDACQLVAGEVEGVELDRVPYRERQDAVRTIVAHVVPLS